MSLKEGHLKISVSIKPTDSKRYLNRRSDHSSHVYRGIPFSQFLRAVVICSHETERQKSIDYMEKKFLDSDTLDQSSRNAKKRRWHLTELQFLQTTGNVEAVLNQRLIF
jgi:hypothetical protein